MDSFPKYLMNVGEGKNKQRAYYTLKEAAVLYSGNTNVSFGRHVLNADFSVILMTKENRSAISKIADAHAGAK